MKKQVKKLVLAKETVRRLEDHYLEQIAGAAPTDPQTCEWSGYRTCATCGRTCGTNLC